MTWNVLISVLKMAGLLSAQEITFEISEPPQKGNNKRKFSFPAALHSSSLLPEPPTSTARRRLSNVSDVVTRKLSHTIGWKAAQIPAQDIITQGRCLCGQYIRRRLKKSGLFNKKLGLQRIRSIIGTSAVSVVRDVFPVLMTLGDELERMHPKVYTGVSRQITRAPGGELESAEAIPLLISAVARDLFRTEITWGKVISLFAMAGGLAVDCVRQDHIDYLPSLVDAVTDVIEDELVPWINEKGGWVGLNTHVYPASNEFSPLEWAAIAIGGFLAILLIVLIVRFIGFYLFPLVYSKTT